MFTKANYRSIYDTLILRTDLYKYSHYLQYKPGTKFISSYIEPRANKLLPNLPIEIVSFGVQAFILKYMTTPITHEHIDIAKKVIPNAGLPFNEAGFRRIVDIHGGLFPVTINALPEGSIFRPGVAQVQVSNNDPELPWVTSFIEMALLRAIWYPSTVATLSREIKKMISSYLEKTSDNPDMEIMFKLHDFGGRGATSGESAELGGAAHLINFWGTDTTEALIGIEKYYLGDNQVLEQFADGPLGVSIPAAEHSTITSWGGRAGEGDALENLITQFGKPGAIYAGVSDSYDIYNAVEHIWGERLKQKIIDSCALLVVRPDSGDPVGVTMKVIGILADKFGYRTNSKGYKVLNYTRVIWGDGIAYHGIFSLLEALFNAGWSIDNIAFGMGAALLQRVNRDDLSYAMKGSARWGDDTNGTWEGFSKDPITAPGKKSKEGFLVSIKCEEDGPWETLTLDEITDKSVTAGNNLIDWEVWPLMYSDGRLYNMSTFTEVRKRAALK